MRYGSVCSGIEAATAAWHPLGWKPAFFSEIEAFPRAVLAHHYPETPLHGDFTTIGADDYGPIDLLVGGTPCQSFSIAGLRGGLDDDRGNLALEFLRLAQRKRPKWLVWENVPGVLSSNGGRDFGAILGGMVECGYGLAYRVLDAQYFGVAQRRRRVFVVGYLGDWRPAAAVLFERHSMSGHPAPSREARKETARAALSGVEERGGRGGNGPSVAGERHIFQDIEFGVSEYDTAGSLRAGRIPEHQMVLEKQWPADVTPTLTSNGDAHSGFRDEHGLVSEITSVRRLTPRECERLQGFPDDYTLVPYRNKPMADGPRYKALGNSMAVPVMRWIGERIQMVENIMS